MPYRLLAFDYLIDCHDFDSFSFASLDLSLQQRLTQRRPRQRTPNRHRLLDAPLITQRRVHLHDIQRDQTTRLCHRFTHVMTFPKRQPTTNRRARASRHRRVTRIDVKAQMNRSVVVGVDVGESHLDHTTDAVLVNFVHGEALYFVFLEDPFFGNVEVAQADVDPERKTREPNEIDSSVAPGRKRGLPIGLELTAALASNTASTTH